LYGVVTSLNQAIGINTECSRNSEISNLWYLCNHYLYECKFCVVCKTMYLQAQAILQSYPYLLSRHYI